MSQRAITTKNLEETQELAKCLVEEWLKINKNKNSNWLICLYGDLGFGKTTFVQGMAKKLKIKEKITSPTFLVIKKYLSPEKDYKKYSLYHLDCYRISRGEDILALGWEEIMGGENNIIVVEWPEKIENVLPKKRLNIKFDFISENKRKINFNSSGF